MSEIVKLIERNKKLSALNAEMLEILYSTLPYVEDAESDKAFKPGVVKKDAKKIRDCIRKAEGK